MLRHFLSIIATTFFSFFSSLFSLSFPLISSFYPTASFLSLSLSIYPSLSISLCLFLSLSNLYLYLSFQPPNLSGSIYYCFLVYPLEKGQLSNHPLWTTAPEKLHICDLMTFHCPETTVIWGKGVLLQPYLLITLSKGQ